MSEKDPVHRNGAPDGFEDPGLEPHRHRQSDVDPRAAQRAERQVVGLLVLSIVAAIGGVVGYFLFPAGETLGQIRLGNTALGLGLGLGMLGIGLAAVHWAKTLMNDTEQIEQRHEIRSDDGARAGAVEKLQAGIADANVARRPLLKGALASAVVLAPLPFVLPLIGNLTPDWDVTRFGYTAWRNKPAGAPGRRLAIDPSGDPIRAADVTIGSTFHVIPHDLGEFPGEDHFLDEKAKAVVLMVRMHPDEMMVSPGREDWSYHGIVAYSKVCTHVGCPVALYEQNTKHVLCPCHQSTFDLADEARVLFGPANRALPQLPISVDEEGYLIATSDFHEPVGPSYWERLR
ncbi:MAG: Rieske 2Fe-2S domain-containing protein [Actinomycetota bacterium]